MYVRIGWPLEEMPFEGMPRFMPWAEYATVIWIDGHLAVEFHRLPVDMDAVRQAALESAMLHADFWVSQWVTV